MLTLDALRDWGANVDEGMARCLNNEAFYMRMLKLQLAESTFDALEQAIAVGDARAAFNAAHALKGAVGNLSLTPIYDPVCEITEKLRGQNIMPDVSEPYEKMARALASLQAMAE